MPENSLVLLEQLSHTKVTMALIAHVRLNDNAQAHIKRNYAIFSKSSDFEWHVIQRHVSHLVPRA